MHAHDHRGTSPYTHVLQHSHSHRDQHRHASVPNFFAIFAKSRNEILETVTPFCHSPPQAEKKNLNSGPRDSGLAPHRRTPLEEPSPRTGSRNLGTRSWAPGTLGPGLGPQEPWDPVLNLIHFTSGPGSRNPNPGQPKSTFKQLLYTVS